jgi:hypothetical protein
MGRTAVIAGTATAVSGHVAAKQQAKYAQQAAAPAPEAPPAAEQATPPAEPVDVVEQLTKFAELRDKGILTEEEFAAQKAKLLAT